MKSDQDLYKRLRDLPKEELWSRAVPGFNVATPKERMENVAVIRAVGRIFSPSAPRRKSPPSATG